MRHMPIAASLLATLALAGCASSPAAAPARDAAPRTVLHPSECLDPALARGWSYVDDDELLVDAGRRKYRVRLAELCFGLGTSPALHFQGDAVSNRVCGHAGEYVVVSRQRCRIQSVERLDDAAWREANGESEAKGRIEASKSE